ncbi:non-ribosomal peptide synthetase/type I polyketide synthase [Bacillus pumilus]|uniref:non-ribosomal peptide synthetase/type I polyketide synthase n=1 Tax=Bacillus pumilus TaxID=1408 RepID=UPI0030D31A32
MALQPQKLDKQNIENMLGITTIQEGLLFHHLMEPNGTAYFEQLLIEIDGPIDRDIFEQSWTNVTKQHEMLRTLFRWQELARPVQIVLKQHQPDIRYRDLTQAKEPLHVLKEEVTAQNREERFDLQEVPFRLTLCEVNDEVSWVLISFHHILLDGWSLGIVLSDWMSAYERLSNGDKPLLEQRPSYQSFVKWQQKNLQQTEAQAAYWKNVFNGWSYAELLPKSSGAYENSEVFHQYEHQVDTSIAESLSKFTNQYDVTLASVMYTLWGVLLSKYANQDDIVFGTTVSGRNADVPHIEKMTGLFINTLPLRVSFEQERPILEQMQEVSREIAIRNEYEHTPLSDLKKYAGMTAEQSLFDSIVVIENYPLDQMLTKNDQPIRIRGFEMTEQTEFDLTLSVQAFDDQLHFSLVYNPVSFSAEQIEKWCQHFLHLLSDACAHPHKSAAQLQLLSEEEKEKQLAVFRQYGGATSSNEPTVIDLFEAQVERTPAAAAVEFGDTTVTYEQLNKRVNQLAHYLQNKGVKQEQRVGILAEHSIEMVIACLAILKAGGAYVPIDPEYPQERIEYLLEDSGVEWLLTHPIKGLTYAYHGERIDITQPDLYTGPSDNLAEAITSDQTAYCIYTSGTTGRPKGVLIHHLGLANYIDWAKQVYVRGETRHFALYTSLSFDLTVTSIFTPLISGNTIMIYHHENRQLLVEDIIKDNRVHVMKLTPSHLQFIKHLSFPDSQMKCFILGGEQLETSLAKSIQQSFPQPIEIVNEYGPTETVVGCMIHRYDQDFDQDVYVPIGKPAQHTDILLFDRHMNLMPEGTVGELYIGGKGVAKGYLNRPELTEERFVDHPFQPGEKIYKTGDAARILPNGLIQFLGRNDDQVKLRGYRIETGEIEFWLNEQPGMKAAAVVVKPDASGTPCLAAYVVTTARLDQAAMKQALADQLPDYMIPTHFVQLDDMPLTANGKLDKRALPALKQAQQTNKQAGAANLSDTEKVIQDIWKKVLGLDEVSVHDKFFDIGGHSLNLIHVNQQLAKQLNQSIPMVEMFRRPTIRELAAYLSGDSEQVAAGTQPVKQKTRKANEPIAIIGMAGKFPGAKNVEAFWRNLKNGEESISFFSDEELLEAGIDRQTFERPDYVRAKGVIDGPDLFDASFFGYSPGQAEMMDPQIRLLHEYAYKALEDAGYVQEDYTGKVGLFTGSTSNFQWIQRFAASLDSSMSELFEVGSLNDTYTVSTRIAHKLNLKGPALTLQTACSTSLVALHLACQSIANGDSDVALAGGVSILHPVKSGYVYQQNMVKSSDGHCRAFDDQADGTVGGDGVGLVALKALSEAIEDGDHIYAVIKGSAINNDGDQKVGFNAPSVEGQTRVIQDALHQADVSPDTIEYVETHGTGTSLGDPIEIEALTKAFDTEKKQFCRIGSVKTNIGHLDAAAGAAGLIKAVLSLQHHTFVPSLHFKKANENIAFEHSPFFVNTELTDWKQPASHLRRAGVSSFGMGGTNAHVILEEAPQRDRQQMPRSAELLVLSAKSKTSLERMKDKLVNQIENTPSINLADAAYTLQTGRQFFGFRQAFVAASREDALRVLTEKQGKGIGKLMHSHVEQQKIIFMFSGQGNQYLNMGLDLYREEPYFKKQMDACFQAYEEATGRSLARILYPLAAETEKAREKLASTQYAQPAIFAIEYALSMLFIEWGIRPDAMIGYSFGELTAAAISGLFSLKDAMSMVAYRANAMQSSPAGVMMSVPLPEAELKPMLPKNISLAVVNDSSCIVSGLEEAISEFEQELKSNRLMCMRLGGTIAAHSHVMKEAAEQFGEKLKHMKAKTLRIPFISNLSGDWMTDTSAKDMSYWKRHMTDTVRFAEGITNILQEDNIQLIEIGPGQDLSVMVNRSLNGLNQHVCHVLRHAKQDVTDTEFLLSQMGRLWTNGLSIDWDRFHLNRQPRKMPLPTYAFDQTSYWYDAADRVKQEKPKQSGRKQQMDEWFYTPHWEADLLPCVPSEDTSGGALLLFAEPSALGEKIAAELLTKRNEFVVVRKGNEFTKHDEKSYTIRSHEPSDYERLISNLADDEMNVSEVCHLWGLSERQPSHTEEEWVKQTQQDAYYSLLYIGQALKKYVLDQKVSITVLSSLTYAVGGEPVLYPEKAIHLGPAMVISQETPNLRYRILDIDRPVENGVQEKRLLKQISDELDRAYGQLLTVYRRNKRYVKKYAKGSVPETGHAHLAKKDGVYILIGGLGFIGLNIAQTLAEQTKGTLILTSRSGLPDRSKWQEWLSTHDEQDPTKKKIQKVMALEETGADVLIQKVDVRHREDIQQLINTVDASYGQIDGVIYAAGVTGDQSFRVMEQTDVTFSEPHFEAKMNGVLHLDAALGDRSLDFCFVLSSLSPILGGLGFTAYTAVNHFIDAYVYERNLRSETQWSVISFDGWEFEQGKQLDLPIGDDVTETLITEKEGRMIFERLLSLDQVEQMVISTTSLHDRIHRYVDRLSREEESGGEHVQDGNLYSRPALSTNYAAPETELEKELSQHWQAFFKIDDIGIDDHFFEMGGDSLKAITFIGIIHRAFSVELTLPQFFQIPTIRLMAAYIDQADTAAYHAIEKAEVKEHYPLSSAQKRLYLMQQMDVNSTGYNEFKAGRIKGKLDISRLEWAFQQLIKRHESLRTAFVLENGVPYQKIEEEVPFAVTLFDLTKGSTQGSEEDQKQVIEQFLTAFTLSEAPLMRVGVMKLAEEEFVLMLDMHHIISDGLSQDILVNDFMQLYDGRTLEPLALQYKDFSEWQNDMLASEALKESSDYWKNRLEGAPLLDLPTDFDRPEVRQFRGGHYTFRIEEAELNAFKQMILKEDATLFMGLLSVYQILLHKLSGQSDITVGVPVAGRKQEELQQVIGIFVNMLPLRLYPKAELTYQQFLQDVKAHVIGDFGHQEYQYEQMVQDLQLSRSVSRNLLFDAVFALQNMNQPELKVGGLTFSDYPYETGTSRFDLLWIAYEQEDGLSSTIEYNTELFSEETIQRIAGLLKDIMRAVSAEAMRIEEIELTSSFKQLDDVSLFELDDLKI